MAEKKSKIVRIFVKVVTEPISDRLRPAFHSPDGSVGAKVREEGRNRNYDTGIRQNKYGFYLSLDILYICTGEISRRRYALLWRRGLYKLNYYEGYIHGFIYKISRRRGDGRNGLVAYGAE